MKYTKTKVIFLWHMHQPYYKLPNSKYYILPWVRLHGIKDYYGMAKFLEQFDKVKVTFNFSGILLHQILDYTENKTQDYYGLLSLKKPTSLTKKEKNFIIDRFFSVNFERFIRSNTRYIQLYQKKSIKANFSYQDILDLQAIYNLCWFHPITIKEDKNLQELIKKGRDYTQDDKEYIINKQYQILSLILPLYRKLLDKGRIELSLTPYMHPIMPLIYDNDVLKEFPYLKKPLVRFSYPKDCIWHIVRSKEIFNKVFSKDIKGSWPSEGSISQDVAKLYTKQGFNWIGADEGILFKSLVSEFVPYDTIKTQRHLIYKPYSFNGLNIFFRDRNLSDTISFVYEGWEDTVLAANDLLEHFKRIHYYAKDMVKNRVITIIMDGENAWEYYKNNGLEFLEVVYSGLENSDILSSTTPTEFLLDSPSKPLKKLSSGSWINTDFGVWIGSKSNNNNWVILKKLRDWIDTCKDKNIKEKALEYFYIIEGSDWNWWNTFEENTGDFKKIFFSYVKEICRLLGKDFSSLVK
ncbi:MAG: glycoside hydrolase family 57 protein [Candidatus Omnitrophica bacterium]|nr:glycoside hydrolase family 57 protein [Candidatus Omnitrophota bacterium]